MLREEDFSDSVVAIKKEIGNHELNDRCEFAPWNDTIGKKALKTIWALKRKHNSNGTMIKHEARTCPHGGMHK